MGIQYIFSQRNVFGKILLIAVVFWGIMGWALFMDRAAEHFKNALETSLISSIIISFFLLVVFFKEKGWLKDRWVAVGLLAVIFAELFYYIPQGRVNKFDSFPPVPYIDLIKKSEPRARAYGIFWTLYPDTAAAYQIDDMGIYEGLQLKRFVAYINNFISPNYFNKVVTRTAFWVFPFPLMPKAKPYLDLLNLKYIVGPNPIRPNRTLPLLENLTFPKPFYSREVNIYRSETVLPRAFIVHRAIFEPDSQKVIEQMKRHENHFSVLAVLNCATPQDIQRQLAQAPVVDNSSVVIKKYSPNEVVLQANMASAGLVILSDTYHPDWKAFIDGRASEIFITDYLVRSVFVPAGTHQIQFVFKPFSFYLGRMVSLAAFLIWMFLLGMSYTKCPWFRPAVKRTNEISNEMRQ
jgi:hypothetical protein